MNGRDEVLTIYADEGPLSGPWCRAEDLKRFKSGEDIEDVMFGLETAMFNRGSEEGVPAPHWKLKAATPEQWAQLLLLVTADHAVSYNASVW